MAAAYVQGATLSELANRYGLNRRTVSSIVTRAGVPTRYRHIGPSELSQALREYQSGKSLASVAGPLGVSANTVRSALLAAGITMRDRYGQRENSH